jgi:hypothetical protein
MKTNEPDRFSLSMPPRPGVAQSMVGVSCSGSSPLRVDGRDARGGSVARPAGVLAKRQSQRMPVAQAGMCCNLLERKDLPGRGQLSPTTEPRGHGLTQCTQVLVSAVLTSRVLPGDRCEAVQSRAGFAGSHFYFSGRYRYNVLSQQDLWRAAS